MAGKNAISVVHLDARREIHNIQPVLGINGYGARTNEIARLRAALAPEDLRLAATSDSNLFVTGFHHQRELASRFPLVEPGWVHEPVLLLWAAGRSRAPEKRGGDLVSRRDREQ